MAKLKDRYTPEEILDLVFQLDLAKDSAPFGKACYEKMRQYLQETLQLDKEQQMELLQLYEGEHDCDYLTDDVREVCGLPALPKGRPPFPCAKIQLGIQLEYYETEEFDEMYIKYEKQMGRDADDIPSCLKLRVIEQLRKSGKMGPGKLVKEISPMEESMLREKAKKFPFILDEDSMLPPMSR